MILSYVLPAFKALSVAGVIVGFLVTAPLREGLMTLQGLGAGEKQRRRARRCSAYARVLLGAMGIRAGVKGREHLRAMESRRGGYLIVSNHMAFWDMILLASETSAVYITSVEIRETPILGWIAVASGCVFTERRDRTRTHEGVTEVARQLSAGVPVVLYAEGTSSDGSGVLPFKKSFFRSALEASVPVLPMCLNYREIDGEPLSPANRDRVFYYGDQTFLSQLRQIFTTREIIAELTFAEPIETQGRELERDAFASAVQEIVASHYDPIAAPSAQEEESQHEITSSHRHGSAVLPGAAS